MWGCVCTLALKMLVKEGDRIRKGFGEALRHQNILFPILAAQVPHTDRQVACHPVNNSRGKRS